MRNSVTRLEFSSSVAKLITTIETWAIKPGNKDDKVKNSSLQIQFPVALIDPLVIAVKMTLFN